MRSEDLTAQNKNEGHVVCMDDMRNAYRIFVISKGNRPMKAMTNDDDDDDDDNNNKTDLIRCEAVEWVHMTQDRDQRWVLVEILCIEHLNFIKPGELIMHWMNIPMTLLQVLNCIQEQICKRSPYWKIQYKGEQFSNK